MVFYPMAALLTTIEFIGILSTQFVSSTNFQESCVMVPNQTTENLRDSIRKIAGSIRAGQECRLERRRLIKDPRRCLSAIKLLLARLLRSGNGSSRGNAPTSAATPQVIELTNRCVYREFLVDGAKGAVCDAVVVGQGRAYCHRHSFLCAHELCANLVEHEPDFCSQCKRSIVYKEGHADRLSAA